LGFFLDGSFVRPAQIYKRKTAQESYSGRIEKNV